MFCVSTRDDATEVSRCYRAKCDGTGKPLNCSWPVYRERVSFLSQSRARPFPSFVNDPAHLFHSERVPFKIPAARRPSFITTLFATPMLAQLIPTNKVLRYYEGCYEEDRNCRMSLVVYLNALGINSSRSLNCPC